MVATDGLSGVGTGSGRRIPKLEGLRGALAMGVLLYHVAFMAGIASFIQQPGDGVWGVLVDGLGVMLPPFFVLSGLFLYRPFVRVTLADGERPKVGRFLARRALRLLPLYWVVTIVGLVAINLYNIDSVADVLRPALLVHFFSADGQPMFGLEHTWTVPTEIAFYLVLPVLAWLGHRYASRTGDLAARARRLLLPAVLFALAGMAWVCYTRIPSLVAAGQFDFLQYFWPLHYLQYFAGGMALAIASVYAEVSPAPPAVHRIARRRPAVLWLAAAVTFFVYALKPFSEPIAGAWTGFAYELTGILASLVFGMLLVLLLTAGGRSRVTDVLLGNRPMRYLGRISYGVYLWHVLVIEWFFQNGSLFGVPAVASIQWRGTVGFLELMAFTTVITLVLATATYYLIERPANAIVGRAPRTVREPEPAPEPEPAAPATRG